MAITGTIEGLGDISLDTGPMEKVFDDLTKSINSLKKDLKEKESADKKNTKAKKDNTDATNDNTDSVSQNSKTSRTLAQRLGFAAGVMAELSDITFRLTSNFSTLGNNIESANRMTFGQIPVLGPALNSIVSASTNVVDRFNQITSSGATFGGSVIEMTRNAAQSGMALDEYTSFISQNALAMRFLGGTVEQGAMQFSAMSLELRTTNRELHSLGFNTRDINDGLANYTRQLGLQGRAERMSRADLISGTAVYLKTLDALAKATGETRREVEQRRMQMTADEQFLASMIGLGDEVATSFLDAVGGIAPGLQNFAKDIMAVGVSTTQENQLLMAMLPESAGMLIDFHSKLQRGESVTLSERNRLNNLLAQEGAANLENIKAAAAASPELRSVVAGITEAMRMHQNALSNATAEQEASIRQQEQLNASVQKGRENIAALSTTLLAFLANESVMQNLNGMFEKLLDITQNRIIPILNDYLMPIVELAATGLHKMFENIELVVAGLATLKLVPIILSGKLLETVGSVTMLNRLYKLKGMTLGAMLLPLLKLVGVFVVVGAAIWGLIKAIRWLTGTSKKQAEVEMQQKTRANNTLVAETEAAADRLSNVKSGSQGSIAVLNELLRPAGTEGIINRTTVNLPTQSVEELSQKAETKQERIRDIDTEVQRLSNNESAANLARMQQLLSERGDLSRELRQTNKLLEDVITAIERSGTTI